MRYILASLNSKHTRRQYQHHLERFFNWQTSNKSYDITREIIIYLHGMKQEGLSYSYRNLALAAIKHYHEMHDFLFNWRKRKIIVCCECQRQGDCFVICKHWNTTDSVLSVTMRRYCKICKTNFAVRPWLLTSQQIATLLK